MLFSAVRSSSLLMTAVGGNVECIACQRKLQLSSLIWPTPGMTFRGHHNIKEL